jgi:hypothetical protein
VGVGLDFDAAHPDRVLVVTHDDDGVVEVHLPEYIVSQTELVGPTAGPDLEEVGQGSVTDQGPQSATHRTIGVQGMESGRGQRLTDLDAAAESAHGRCRVLQGHLRLVRFAAHPEDES